jgi:phage terminase Nu1 subunit (DNA packaging protein)
MQVSDLQVENDALKAELELWRKDPEGAMVKGLNKSLHAAKEELAAEQSQTAQLKEEIQVWEEIVAGLEARLEEALKL